MIEIADKTVKNVITEATALLGRLSDKEAVSLGQIRRQIEQTSHKTGQVARALRLALDRGDYAFDVDIDWRENTGTAEERLREGLAQINSLRAQEKAILSQRSDLS